MQRTFQLAERYSHHLRNFALLSLALAGVIIVLSSALPFSSDLSLERIPHFLLTLISALLLLMILEGLTFEIGNSRSVHCVRCVISFMMMMFAGREVFLLLGAT